VLIFKKMITNVPKARLYFLSPSDNPTKFIPIGDTRICGGEGSTLTYSQLLTNILGYVMTDDDISDIVASGLEEDLERCILKVTFGSEHCMNILMGGLNSADKVFKEFPHLVPEGGISFTLRDWEDIPEEEKAGH
jgi:hypothetical protein